MISQDQQFESIRQTLVGVYGDFGQKLFDSGRHFVDPKDKAKHYKVIVEKAREGSLIQWAANTFNPYRRTPVDMQTFFLSPYYLGLEGEIYPEVYKELCELNNGSYVEAVLTGAIGTAKTTIALWTNAYQLYLLSCLKNPQKTFGLEKASEIVFIFQSISAKLAKSVDYARFRALIEVSPYFNKHFPFNKDLESELQFPNRIIVKPVSGADTAAIGQNVMGGVIDEINYMAVIENSKSSIDGGVYDQAIALYNSIARRRKSRFMQQGKLPGILCLVSSRRYPGQFTDTKEEEAKKDKTIFVYDKRVWEIKPDSFCGEWFQVFLGNEFENPFIIELGDNTDRLDQALIMNIPVEYRTEFETDIINAVREIAGYSTLSRHPFLTNAGSITQAMGLVSSILSKTETDFDANKLEVLLDNIENKSEPRYIHADLSVSGDSTGLSCGYVKEFVEIVNGDDVEILPKIVMDFTLEIKPPKGGEIQFHKIRKLIYILTAHGVNVRWVSFDSYQSKDSMQILAQRGYSTGMVSMDTSIVPYQFLKNAFYTGRIEMDDHPKLRRELLSLEYNPKDVKVDHPSTGSKDIADSLAGVVYGLTTRREIWARHKVSVQNLPPSVGQALQKEVQKDK